MSNEINQIGTTKNNAVEKPSLIMNSHWQYRSLEASAQFNYSLTIGEVFSDAWRLTNGFKLNFFLGFLLSSAISYAVTMLVTIIFSLFAIVTLIGLGIQLGSLENLETQLAYNPIVIGTIIILYFSYLAIIIIVSVPLMTLMMGLFVLAQKRANDLKVWIVKDLCSPFRVFWKLLLLQLLISVLYIGGIILFILPGLYVLFGSSLSVLLLFAYPQHSGFEIFKASFRIVNKQFFKIAGMFLLLFLINFVAMIPLGIGLIWSLPFSYLCLATLLQRVIVISSEPSAD